MGWNPPSTVQGDPSDIYLAFIVFSTPWAAASLSGSYICAVQHIKFSHIPFPHSIWHTLSDVMGCFRLRTMVELALAEANTEDEPTTGSEAGSRGLATSSGWMVAEWMP